jgi:adenylate cyclase
MTLAAYLPQDRRRALARGESLPDRAQGAVLFADISGFTALTEQLRNALGPRRGAEELTRRLNAVYDDLIAIVERHGGSVIGFAGDAITCWFGERDDRRGTEDERPPTAARAVACGLALQAAIRPFANLIMPDGATAELTLKIAVAAGEARRFVVGDPAYGYLDALAGAAVSRAAVGERLAAPGEVVVDEAVARSVGADLSLSEWRVDPDAAVGIDSRFAAVHAGKPVSLSPAPFDPPALDPTIWRPWLHPAVYEREQAGRTPFLAEFRPCAALFIRFDGLDYAAPSAQERLDAFARQVQAAAARYDGVLLHLIIGDKGSYLYLNFGALSAHEDNARRALKTALAVRQAAEQFEWLNELQIGLAQGMMWTGVYGAAARCAYSAFGDDVNLAARLMQTAAPGEILISGRVQQAVAADFAAEPRPPLTLKGKTEPLPVFAVTAERKQRAIRLQEPAYALPLVGRQTELQTIQAKLKLAQEGRAQIIGLVAEAGVGKSRLAAEAIRLARQNGFVGYGGACQSDGVAAPYLVWKPIWQAFFELDPEMPVRKQLRWLEGEIEDRAPARAAAMPLLNVLLELNIPENEFTQALEPKIRQSALHALLEDCLRSAAQEAPLLIVMEDLHWIDALSHDLLAELVKALADQPICFLLAYRPTQQEASQTARLENLSQFTLIALSELSAAEAALAIRAKLSQLYPARHETPPPELIAALMERTQGNPFYLEELLNYLRDRGFDPYDPAALDKIALPDTLHALILSRIDQLNEREKRILRAASVVGRLFRAHWLTGYYPDLGTLPEVKPSLDALDRLDITPLDRPEPELSYLFKHIVTHEATYESMPFAARAELHERLARYLESVYADSPPLEALAFHYGRTDNIAKQVAYLRKAGEAAQKNYANEAALDFYGRLLPLLADGDEKQEIYARRGQTLELMGRWDEAEADFRAALELAQKDMSRTVAAQFDLGRLSRLRGDYVQAVEWLTAAQALYELLADQEGLTRLFVERGMVLLRQGDYERARASLQQGLTLSRVTGDKPRMALALNNLGVAASDQGNYVAAQTLYEESLALRREIKDKAGICDSLNNLGIVAWYQADYGRAWAFHQESLAARRDIGDRWGIALSLNNLGLVALSQGNYATAGSLHEESLALRREIGDKPGISACLDTMGSVALAQGDYDAAQALYEECLVLDQEMGDKWGMAISLNNLANVAYNRGDYAAAEALYENSLALRRGMDDKWGMAYALLGLGLVGLTRPASEGGERLIESLRIRRDLGERLNQTSSLIALAGLAWRQEKTEWATQLLGAADAALKKLNTIAGD